MSQTVWNANASRFRLTRMARDCASRAQAVLKVEPLFQDVERLIDLSPAAGGNSTTFLRYR